MGPFQRLGSKQRREDREDRGGGDTPARENAAGRHGSTVSRSQYRRQYRRRAGRGLAGRFPASQAILVGAASPCLAAASPELLNSASISSVSAALRRRLPAFVDEPRKQRFHRIRIWRGGDLHVALEPLLCRRVAHTSRNIGGDIDLLQFRVVPGLKQGLRPGKKCFDEIYDVAVALGHHSKIGGHEEARHRDGVARLIRRDESRIIVAVSRAGT